METQDIINEYKTKFKMDPLLNRIRNEGLEDELFGNADYYTRITFSDSYSTTQAVDHLSFEGKDQTLINYITRNDLQSYLAISKHGRFYRYDWISLFKFKMIFLLNKYDFTPMDIAGIIGTKVETAIEFPGDYNEQKLKITGQSIREIVKQESNENMENMLHTLKTFESYKEQQTILNAKKDNHTIDLKLRDERIWSIQGRLDDLDGYLSFMKVSNTYNEEPKPGGLLGWLFKSKDPNNENKQGKIQDEVTAFEEKKRKLNEAIAAANDEKKEISLKIKEIDAELDTLKQTAATISNKANSLGSISANINKEGEHDYGLSTKVIDTN